MTNAAIQKRLTKLEIELKKLKAAVYYRPGLSIDEKNWRIVKPAMKKIKAHIYKEHYGTSRKKRLKPLPKWLRASLRDVEEGRVSGPFDTVEELMAHLQK